MLSFPCVDRSISLRIAPVVYPVLSLGDEKGHFCFSRVPKPDHTCCLLSEVWTVVVPSHATPLSPRNTHLFLFQFKGTTTNRASPKTCSHTNRRVTTTSGEYTVSSPDICHRLPHFAVILTPSRWQGLSVRGEHGFATRGAELPKNCPRTCRSPCAPSQIAADACSSKMRRRERRYKSRR